MSKTTPKPATERKATLAFGAMCKPLATQLREQAFGYDKETMQHMQRDADAITRLLVRGLLPASAADAARTKLMKQIGKHCWAK